MSLVPYIPPDKATFANSNPWLNAVQALTALHQQRAQLQTQQITNAVLPETLRIKNALNAATAAQKQFRTQHPLFNVAGNPISQQAALDYLSQTRGTNSELYQNAKAGVSLADKFRQAEASYLNRNQILKYLPLPVRSAIIAQGTDLNTGQMPSPLTTGQVPISNSTVGNATQPIPTNTTPYTNTPHVRQIARDATVKQTTDVSQRQQRLYSKSVGKIYNQMNAWVPSVMKYAGVGGSLRRGLAHIGTALGDNDPDYNHYVRFKQLAIALANEMRRSMGGPSTREDQKLMSILVNPAVWDKSPQLFLQLWRDLGESINRNGTVMGKSPSQAAQQSGHEATLLPSHSTSTSSNAWVRVIAPNGQSGRIPKANWARAKAAGYRLNE